MVCCGCLGWAETELGKAELTQPPYYDFLCMTITVPAADGKLAWFSLLHMLNLFTFPVFVHHHNQNHHLPINPHFLYFLHSLTHLRISISHPPLQSLPLPHLTLATLLRHLPFFHQLFPFSLSCPLLSTFFNFFLPQIHSCHYLFNYCSIHPFIRHFFPNQLPSFYPTPWLLL